MFVYELYDVRKIKDVHFSYLKYVKNVYIFIVELSFRKFLANY